MIYDLPDMTVVNLQRNEQLSVFVVQHVVNVRANLQQRHAVR